MSRIILPNSTLPHSPRAMMARIAAVKCWAFIPTECDRPIPCCSVEWVPVPAATVIPKAFEWRVKFRNHTGYNDQSKVSPCGSASRYVSNGRVWDRMGLPDTCVRERAVAGRACRNVSAVCILRIVCIGRVSSSKAPILVVRTALTGMPSSNVEHDGTSPYEQ